MMMRWIPCILVGLEQQNKSSQATCTSTLDFFCDPNFTSISRANSRASFSSQTIVVGLSALCGCH